MTFVLPPHVQKAILRRQKRSVAQEKRVAREHAGRRVAGSGSQPGNKGDVTTDAFLIEVKMTKSARFSLTLALWRKIWGEAVSKGKRPAMFIEMAGRTVVVIDPDDFKVLLTHV